MSNEKKEIAREIYSMRLFLFIGEVK